VIVVVVALDIATGGGEHQEQREEAGDISH
jgi:hypothetical protein